MVAMQRIARGLSVLSLGLLPLFYEAAVAAEAPYYQGKTITVLEARAAGGTGSLRVQAAVKYLLKYLPGNPAVVYQYMAGGGGIAAVNHIANVAKRDGLTIGSVSSGIFSNVIAGSPAIRFKLEDLVFLGAGVVGTPTALVIRPGLGMDSPEKLRAYKGLRFANRSVGHSMYIRDRITAFILELKEPQWVLGYDDREIRLALERGEADAMFGGIPGYLRETKHWFGQGFTAAVILKNARGQGAENYPDFPQGRPGVEHFADTELKKTVLKLYHASNAGGSLFYVARGIPEPVLKVLKEAFNRVWSDPQFAEEYERLTRELANPITGDEVQELLRQMPRDPKVLEVYKQIAAAGPLPPAK